MRSVRERPQNPLSFWESREGWALPTINRGNGGQCPPYEPPSPRPSPKGRWRTAALLLLLLLTAAAPSSAAEAAKAKVYVVLWFDTEDYLLPASDDAALRVADFLSQEKIRATFKIVGEK